MVDERATIGLAGIFTLVTAGVALMMTQLPVMKGMEIILYQSLQTRMSLAGIKVPSDDDIGIDGTEFFANFFF